MYILNYFSPFKMAKNGFFSPHWAGHLQAIGVDREQSVWWLWCQYQKWRLKSNKNKNSLDQCGPAKLGAGGQINRFANSNYPILLPGIWWKSPCSVRMWLRSSRSKCGHFSLWADGRRTTYRPSIARMPASLGPTMTSMHCSTITKTGKEENKQKTGKRMKLNKCCWLWGDLIVPKSLKCAQFGAGLIWLGIDTMAESNSARSFRERIVAHVCSIDCMSLGVCACTLIRSFTHPLTFTLCLQCLQALGNILVCVCVYKKC